MLRILGLAESTYYERLKRTKRSTETSNSPGRGRPCPGYSLTLQGRKVSDEQIKEWLLELLEGEEYIYGYKLLAQCLRDKYDLVLGKSKAYRLCKELGILQKRRKPKSKHPRRLARNRLVTGPNQLWQADIKYGYVPGRDRFFFVFSIIDVFDRVIVAYYRGSVCEATHICQALGRAIRSRLQSGESMPVIRTDNGPQFLSVLFGDTCESWEILHERIPPKTPNMNAYIESFHSSMEHDLLTKKSFETMEDAYAAIDWYMDFYNNRRMHGSLKRKAPTVFSEWVKRLKEEDQAKFHRTL
ncbi:MAG: IS3 family transposase [Paenibacillus macerans]|uniref:IS3 family transposase n=1 Tax=Paenibacillus macerans TaxID=44252 RepID=UPI00290B4BC2|nr:IS3 family transposase [Paenibacillus macerans]MDU7478036.1 IS3 family transposase [Paenibacillus macerans]MEC0334169.1 IS3 family transposase [Paenibacillus macerans]